MILLFIYFIYIRYLDTTVTINKSKTLSHFPIPEELDMEGTDIATRWLIWKNKWNHYYIATELDKKKGQTIVSTLLTILGESTQKSTKILHS